MYVCVRSGAAVDPSKREVLPGGLRAAALAMPAAAVPTAAVMACSATTRRLS